MISRLFGRKSSSASSPITATAISVPHVYRARLRYGEAAISPEVLAPLVAELHKYHPMATTPPSLKSIGRIREIEATAQGAILQGANATLHLNWIAPDCIHLSHTGVGDARAAQMAALQSPLPTLHSAIELERDDLGGEYRIASGAADCRINMNDGRLSIALSDGTPAMFEARPPQWYGDTLTRFALQSTPDTLCAGFGARVQSINIRNYRLQGYPSRSNGMIAAVPFALLVSAKASCGIYWRTSARFTVDARGLQPGEMLVEIEDGRLDYVIMVSPSPIGVMARLGSLLPAASLPPLWGLGLHVGGAGLDSAEQVLEVTRSLRERGMPCSAVQLGAAVMDSGRPLTVSAERFPNFKEVVDELHADGVQVVVEVHPALQVDERYPLYISGKNRNAFVSYSDSTSVRGTASAAISVFPDFLREDVRIWWSEQMRPMMRAGIDGIALYNASPDLELRSGMDTLPDGARHTFHAGQVSHPQVRSLYAGRMAMAGQLALDRHRGPLRPFIRQTSGSLDLRQSGLLTIEMAGDWDGLRSALRAVLNASASGISLAGLEIDTNEGDLMVRALQAGCLLPGLLGWTQRDGVGLPWSFGSEIESACRETLSLRSRVLPYLYTCIALAREYGVPVVRPLWMLQPDNQALWGIEDEYLIGDHLLAAPVLQVGKMERSVMVPDGMWYDYWTNHMIEGGKVHVVEAPLHRLPLFVRAGAVLPLASDRTTGEQIPIVRVYPGDSETTTYDDSGEGFSHLNGDYRWVYYTCHWESNRCFVLQRRRAGGFYPSDKRLRFEIVGLEEPPEEVRLDRHGAPLWYFDQDHLEIVADDEAGRVEVWLEGSPTTPTRKRRAL